MRQVSASAAVADRRQRRRLRSGGTRRQAAGPRRRLGTLVGPLPERRAGTTPRGDILRGPPDGGPGQWCHCAHDVAVISRSVHYVSPLVAHLTCIALTC